jgi:hypothetical protein
MPKKAVAICIFVSICILFAAARLWRLDASCLWFDEMFSVQAAEMPWSGMFQFLALDLVHPPLFYVLLKVWIGIGGSGIFWARLLPVLFGCLAIIPFVLLCRELRQSTRVTLLSLFLLAANGSLIKYAQEVRMYTLLMLVSLCSLWLFARYLNRGKGFAALVAVNVLAVYIHYYSWAFSGCEVLTVLIFDRQKAKRILLMAGIVFAAFIPWAYVILTTARDGYLAENIAWIKRPTFRVLFDYFFDLIEPFFFQTSSAEPASVYLVTIPLLILIFIAACAAAASWKEERLQRNVIGMLAIFSIATLAAVFVASWVLPYSVWGTRHLIIIVAPVMLLISNAFFAVPSGWGKGVLTALLTTLVTVAGVLALRREAPAYVWCGWEPLVTAVSSPVSGREPIEVFASENLAAYHTWFATRGSDRFRVHIVPAPEGEFVDREYFPPRGFEGVKKTELDEITEPRILVIYRRERPFMTEWLRLRLEAKGYTACSPRSIEFGPSTIVRLEMKKGVDDCIY